MRTRFLTFALLLVILAASLGVSNTTAFGPYQQKPIEWAYDPGMVVPEFQGLTEGLIAYWAMWEGGEAPRDISGQANHAGLSGATTEPIWIQDTEGLTLDFDGLNDTLLVSASQALIDLPTTYNFTILIRHKSNDLGTINALFSWSGSDDLVIYPNDPLDATGGYRVFWRDVGGSLITEAGPDLTGEWHTLAFVSRAADDHELFRDGVSIGTSVATGAAGPFSSVHIGSFDTGSQFFEGNIAAIKIYARALSDSEIEQDAAYPYGASTPDYLRNPEFIPSAVAAPVTQNAYVYWW